MEKKNKKQIWVKNEKDLKKAVKNVKKNEVVILDEKRPTEKELKAWANQKVIITCTMHEAGDLMDLLFMADASPFNNAFRDTIKLNKMEKAYGDWLNKMIDLVCPEIKNARRKKQRRKN
jgi:3-phosphoglycerate kinase